MRFDDSPRVSTKSDYYGIAAPTEIPLADGEHLVKRVGDFHIICRMETRTEYVPQHELFPYDLMAINCRETVYYAVEVSRPDFPVYKCLNLQDTIKWARNQMIDRERHAIPKVKPAPDELEPRAHRFKMPNPPIETAGNLKMFYCSAAGVRGYFVVNKSAKSLYVSATFKSHAQARRWMDSHKDCKLVQGSDFRVYPVKLSNRGVKSADKRQRELNFKTGTNPKRNWVSLD